MSRRRSRVHDRAVATLETALVAALIAALPVYALNLLSRLQFGPPVGEILTFRFHDQPRPTWHVDARRSSTNRSCILRPAVMAVSQGSMVVERRLPDGRTFLAHWAGGPTSDDAGNCGSDVDLAIGLAAMQTLVSADATAVHWHFMGL